MGGHKQRSNDNHHEQAGKRHSPRILSISAGLIRRLEPHRKDAKILNTFTLYRNFYYRRKVTDRKLRNPRLLHIKFTTFRHWKATKEDHRTKNSLYFQKLLGHKNIRNTLIYIDLKKPYSTTQTKMSSP